MDKKLVKIIKGREYWKAEGPAVMKLCEAPVMGFANISRYNKGLKYYPLFFFTKNEYGYQFLGVQDSIEMIDYHLKKGEKYIKKHIKMWAGFDKKTFALAGIADKIDLADLSDKELWNLYDNFHENLINAWSLPMFVEGNSMYFEKVLIPKICTETGLSEPEAMAKAAVLTTPDKPAFSKREYISLLQVAIEEKSLDKHQKDFYWVRNNYRHVAKITKEQFQSEVEEIKKSKSAEQIKKELDEALDVNKLKRRKANEWKALKISKSLKDEIKNFVIFGWWHDERKRVNLQSLQYVAMFMDEISKRMGLGSLQSNNVTNKEVKNFLLYGKKLDVKMLRERENLMLYVLYDNHSFKILSGKEAKVYFDLLIKATSAKQQKSGEIKGYVACNGGKKKISGRVSLVMDVKNDKFEKGAILVTSMTRPEYVPIMKLASAIVTNEGGITSHAAIVSRELNIPCIIGTKNGTDILKNGEKIEINLESGAVKILKK